MVHNALAADVPGNRLLIAPGRNRNLAQVRQPRKAPFPQRMHRLAAAESKQAEARRVPRDAGEENLVEHLRGNAHGFLRIGIAPTVRKAGLARAHLRQLARIAIGILPHVGSVRILRHQAARFDF